MPQNSQKKESWTDYAKRLAAGQLGLAAAYALSSRNPKTKKKKPTSTKRGERPDRKPKRDTRKPGPKQAGAGLIRSKRRVEQAAKMSRGEY